MDPIIYEINEREELRLLAGGWMSAAEAHGAPQLARGILGSPIWDYIDGHATRQVYGSLVKRAREGHTLSFHYRCDSPEQRRYMRLIMHPASANGVRFESDTLVTRLWPGPVRPFHNEHDVPLCVCSWCMRVRIDEQWEQPERAVDHFGMFVGATEPSITHGICPDCVTRVERTLLDA